MEWELSAIAPSLVIRGKPYPVLLPKLRDPRLHLAATITSLQVIGQIGFHFELSIVQILLALGTCAVLEVAIAFRTQRVIMWPASAMLTGNGVAFVLRVPGTAQATGGASAAGGSSSGRPRSRSSRSTCCGGRASTSSIRR